MLIGDITGHMMHLWRKRPVQLLASLTSVGGAPAAAAAVHGLIVDHALSNLFFKKNIFPFVNLFIRLFQTFSGKAFFTLTFLSFSLFTFQPILILKVKNLHKHPQKSDPHLLVCVSVCH